MAKELSIGELIKKQVKENEKIEIEKMKQAEVEAVRKVQQAKIKAQQKALKAQQATVQRAKITKFRDTIFQNCYELLKECQGLEVSKSNEKQSMKKFDFKGKVQCVPTLTDKICRCTLQVSKRKIITFDIARIGTKSIEVNLVVFNGLQNYYIAHFGDLGKGYERVFTKKLLSTSKNAKEVESSIYKDVKTELVKYISTIIVGMGTEVKPKKKEKKKKEKNVDGFNFFSIGK